MFVSVLHNNRPTGKELNDVNTFVCSIVYKDIVLRVKTQLFRSVSRSRRICCMITKYSISRAWRKEGKDTVGQWRTCTYRIYMLMYKLFWSTLAKKKKKGLYFWPSPGRLCIRVMPLLLLCARECFCWQKKMSCFHSLSIVWSSNTARREQDEYVIQRFIERCHSGT